MSTTSQERLLAVLSGRIPDRVPISCYELVGYDFTNWYYQHPSYKSLMDLIRNKTDCLYMATLPEPPYLNVVNPQQAAEMFPSGITYKKRREGRSLLIEVTCHTPKGDLKGTCRTDDDIFTVWRLEHLLKDIDDIDKYISFECELPDRYDLNEFATTQAILGENGIMMPSLSDPICEVADLFEMGQFLVLSMTNTNRILYLMDFIHERQMSYLKNILKSGISAGVDWSQCLFRICGPEYATPPYLPPRYFSIFVTPYVRRMSDLLHQYGAKMRFHCHGKIGKVLDEIIKTEPDAIDPIEPLPDGDITLGEVKKRIGNKVCLFGNIELKLLEHGQPEEVCDFVIEALKQAKSGGRFVCMPTAAPINDKLSLKTENNYRIFIETVLEYGMY
jgi:uroporphyrinogen-III decarboxylase